jgi:hypothetical protein
LPWAPAETSWARRFWQSDDLASFVREASVAAENGDAAAAWYVGEAMFACGLVVKAVKAGRSQEEYLASWTTQFTSPE